jgi:hypothetical protein
MDKAQQVAQDFSDVFTSEAGQRVLVHISMMAGLFEDISETDPIAMAQRVGMQNLAKQIITLHGTGLHTYMKHLKQGGEDYGRDTIDTGWQ